MFVCVGRTRKEMLKVQKLKLKYNPVDLVKQSSSSKFFNTNNNYNKVKIVSGYKKYKNK